MEMKERAGGSGPSLRVGRDRGTKGEEKERNRSEGRGRV